MSAIHQAPCPSQLRIRARFPTSLTLCTGATMTAPPHRAGRTAADSPDTSPVAPVPPPSRNTSDTWSLGERRDLLEAGLCCVAPPSEAKVHRGVGRDAEIRRAGGRVESPQA